MHNGSLGCQITALFLISASAQPIQKRMLWLMMKVNLSSLHMVFECAASNGNKLRCAPVFLWQKQFLRCIPHCEVRGLDAAAVNIYTRGQQFANEKLSSFLRRAQKSTKFISGYNGGGKKPLRPGTFIASFCGRKMREKLSHCTLLCALGLNNECRQLNNLAPAASTC